MSMQTEGKDQFTLDSINSYIEYKINNKFNKELDRSADEKSFFDKVRDMFS